MTHKDLVRCQPELFIGGNMIEIDEFIGKNNRVLKTGWVAYDEVYGWRWFTHKPFIDEDKWEADEGVDYNSLSMFNLKKYVPWRSSLRRIILGKNNLGKVVNARTKSNG